MATIVVRLITLVLISLVLSNKCNAARATPKSKFPAILVFGDSTVDSGNNNDLQTFMKANFPPHGVEYPGRVATGRFGNGKLASDLLGSALGIKDVIPPYLRPNLSDAEIVTGVNFASAGAGYDNLTTVFTRAISLLGQVELFKSYKARLERVVGKKKADKIIGEAMVLVSASSNDWVINYFGLPTRRTLNASRYSDFLLDRVQRFTKALYKLGCRTMLITGLPPIGCIPLQMTLNLQFQERHCLEDQNEDAQLYNRKLQYVLIELQKYHPGSRIEYINIYDTVLSMMKSPQQYGFEITTVGCCGGPFLCIPTSPYCDDTSKFLFWDSLHPSEAANRHVTNYIVKYIIPKL